MDTEQITPLTPIEVRVLGCLIEKEATTPDQYPLTQNALVSACNQKTNRDPVARYQPGEVGHALRELETRGLVHRAWSARADRYEHRFGDGYEVLSKGVAVLCVLMLRGPQTPGEIRARTQRIHAFDDTDDVEYVLERLAERESPLVRRLPRGPGQKEDRFVHLLAGEPELPPTPAVRAAPSTPAASARSALEDRVAELEEQVAQLSVRLAALEGAG